MTTTSPFRSPPASTRMLSSSTDALLRFALRADATLTGLSGLMVAAFANPLSRVSGLTPTTEYLIGAAFVLYGVAVYLMAALPSLRAVGIGVSAANVAGTLATLAIVATDTGPLTEAGMTVVFGAGIYTAFFAFLQYLGVRRLRA